MRKYKLNSYHKKIIADTITPVEVYLKIRDVFPNSLLLESSDYRSSNNNFSFICFNKIGSIKIKDFVLEEKFAMIVFFFRSGTPFQLENTI